ncbi:Transmembrane protein of unknown function [Raineyella antarctica]|uniref:DUF3566 domain-containing protein n=1 Tax=Raineyella antarctica TaxID=1577474 RepID=A0A1G6HSX9_9ACTN|nr:DUF3566 domain-containing protein [Raineyella antarctica]SDB97407.1 Transmembrane protein of unknown function [Raineyella antarctica]
MSDARPDSDVDATAVRSTEEFYGPAGIPESPQSPTPLRRASQPDAAARTQAHRTRKARLRLSSVDPWSVMKTSFVFSVAFGVAALVLVLLVWVVLSTSGVFDLINQTVGTILRSPGENTAFRIQDYFGLSKVMGLTILLSVLNVVILTAMATLMAFLYNTASRLIGGLEITLAED